MATILFVCNQCVSLHTGLYGQRLLRARANLSMDFITARSLNSCTDSKCMQYARLGATKLRWLLSMPACKLHVAVQHSKHVPLSYKLGSWTLN